MASFILDTFHDDLSSGALSIEQNLIKIILMTLNNGEISHLGCCIILFGFENEPKYCVKYGLITLY